MENPYRLLEWTDDRKICIINALIAAHPVMQQAARSGDISFLAFEEYASYMFGFMYGDNDGESIQEFLHGILEELLVAQTPKTANEADRSL